MRIPASARRWSLLGVACLLALVPLGHLLLMPTALLPALYADGLALLLLGVVGIVGTQLPRQESPEFVMVATAWTLAGVGGLTLLELWIFSFGRLSGLVFPDPVSTAVMFIAVGALLGLPIGLTDARRRQRTSELAAERERMTFLNDLMRHNVLNAFQVIMGRAERIRERGPAGDDVAADGVGVADSIPGTARTDTVEDAETILQWATDAAAQVRKVRLLAGGGDTLRPVRLDVVLCEQASKVREGTGADVRLDAPGERWVEGDEALAALFESLLLNAIEHGAGSADVEGGSTGGVSRTNPTILGDSVEGIAFEDADAEAYPTVRIAVETDAETVTVRVVDDGSGLPDAVIDAIETGHPEPDVFGFGLYLVSTLTDRYGGSLAAGDDARGDIDLDGAAVAVTLCRVDPPS